MLRPIFNHRFIASAVLAAAFLSPTLHAAGRPNIVFILADDLGYMDIGANNPKTFYETPNIDGIAATRWSVEHITRQLIVLAIELEPSGAPLQQAARGRRHPLERGEEGCQAASSWDG